MEERRLKRALEHPFVSLEVTDMSTPPTMPQPPEGEAPDHPDAPHGAPAWPGWTLALGDEGDHVRMAQQHLAARGWRISADGKFGSSTQEVVATFQSERGIATAGVIDRGTWYAIWGSRPAGSELLPDRQPPPLFDEELKTLDAGEHPDPVGQIEAWGFEDVAAFQVTFAYHDIAVDNIAGPETARAVQMVLDRGGYVSEFFHFDELRSNGNGRILSHRQLLRRADEVRRRKGSWTPVSAYRDSAYNATIPGAAPNSQHVFGTAFDIPEWLGLSVDEAIDIGFSGIGRCFATALHGDVRAEGPNNTTPGSQVGNPAIWDYC